MCWALGQRLEEHLSHKTVLQSLLDGGESLRRDRLMRILPNHALWAHLEETRILNLKADTPSPQHGARTMWGPLKSIEYSTQTILFGKEPQTWGCIRNTLNMHLKHWKQTAAPYPLNFWFIQLPVGPKICLSKTFDIMLRPLTLGPHFEKHWPRGSKVTQNYSLSHLANDIT